MEGQTPTALYSKVCFCYKHQDFMGDMYIYKDKLKMEDIVIMHIQG